MRQLLVGLFLVGCVGGAAHGQPGDKPRVPPLASVLKETRAVVVAKYIRTSEATPVQPPIPEFEMLRLASQNTSSRHLRTGQTLHVFWPLSDGLNCKTGDERLLALHVINSHTFGWMVVDLTDEQKAFIDGVPKPTPEHPGADLEYWFPKLLSDDDLKAAIARIALIEASPDAFLDVAHTTPVESLRQLREDSRLGWIARPQVTAMLGVAGDATDATAIEKEIDSLLKEMEQESSYVSLRAGLLAYLLLRGEPGLEVLRDRWLSPSSNTALPRAVVPALQFVATRPESKIPHKELVETAQMLFDNDGLLPEVLAFSARYRNWTLLPKVQRRFSDTNDEALRINLVRYLLTARSQTSIPAEGEPPSAIADSIVAELKRQAPEQWKELEATARMYPYKLEPVKDAAQ